MPLPWSDDLRLDPADLAVCRDVLRDGSRSFFAASLLLPERVRAPACALYAFCRVADDAVDVGGRVGAIARLHDRLELAYDGRPAAHPVDRAFAATVARFAIPRAVPEALLEGLAWDTAGRRYADLGALNAYAVRVAGTVGVMMSLVMGVRDPRALARACDLGVAMQLTNIARDVGEDARAGRLYLPEDWLRAAGIEPAAWLASPRFDPALAGVIERLLAAAERLYRRAESGIGRLPLACRPAIYGARFVYAEIGRELERRGRNSVESRAVVGSARKARLLAKALAAAPVPRRAGSPPPLEEARFLVEAVADQAAVWPTRPVGLGEQVAWVLTLFERLERRERMAAADLRPHVLR